MIWQEKRLGDLADIQLGKMLDQKKNRGEYRPYLGNDNVQWNELKLDEIKLMRIQDSERERFRLRPGDLLVCEGGDPGRCALWTTNEEIYYQKALHRVRVGSELDPEYLLYYMMHLGTTQAIRQYYTGSSTIKHLPNAAIKRVVIRYPSLSDQKMIASYLRSYDVLIENNRKQIKLLEEAAQRLYKEWFIDLRFPGHEVAEIDPDTGLPEGWKADRPMGELIEKLESGKRPKGGIDKTLTSGVPSIGAENVIGIGRYNYDSEKIIPVEFFEGMRRGVVHDRDILVYKDGAYTGRVSLIQDGFPYEKCAVNEHVFLVSAKKESDQYWLYFTLERKGIFNAIQKVAISSAQPGINQDDFKSIKILIPTEDFRRQYTQTVAKLVSQIILLAKQIRTAVLARDRLLLKLMEGEVEL